MFCYTLVMGYGFSFLFGSWGVYYITLGFMSWIYLRSTSR